MPVDISVGVDVYQIGQAIANAVNANQNRPGFVNNLMGTARFRLPCHNVMIFDLNQEYAKSLNGLIIKAICCRLSWALASKRKNLST